MYSYSVETVKRTCQVYSLDCYEENIYFISIRNIFHRKKFEYKMKLFSYYKLQSVVYSCC